MTRLITAALIVAELVLAGPASAAPRRGPVPDRFDGLWNVQIVTESGSCDRSYRYPVRIEHGRARFVGLAFAVQGGVAPNGTLRGAVSNGIATADVSGRLRPDGSGTGRWVASGALDCRGRWSAERYG